MNDEEFLAKLLATFQVEAEEHLKALSDGVIALESNDLTQNRREQIVETIFREAHSLKGAARSVNQHSVEKICQALENVLAVWKQGSLHPSANLFNALYATLDLIEKNLSTPLEQNTIDKALALLQEAKEKSLIEGGAQEQLLKSKPTQQVQEEPKKEEQAETIEKQPAPPAIEHPHIEAIKEGDNGELNPSPLTKEAPKEKYIRISLPKMNRLFQEAEEMLMAKLISQQQVASLKQLFTNYRAQEKELGHLSSEVQILRQTSLSETFSQRDSEAIKKLINYLDRQQREMKSAKEHLSKLIKLSEQNTHFVESMVDALIEDMKKVLMQPTYTLFESMQRMIRDLAHELQKEIRVEFQGGDIEVDRRILEEIKDPVIHLIRNAIDHGIEVPEERTKMDKPPFGTIKIIAAESSGNNVALSIVDDGKGMDTKKLKEVATKQGLLSKEEAAALTDEEAFKLAFHSGISTSPTVTELSGRGLGLGIVSEKVDKLGGQIFIESKINQGTTFKLLLPSTLATFRGIHIVVAGQEFIMPTHNVKRVFRIKKEEIKTVANAETIIVDGRSVSFMHLADLLGIAKKEEKESSEFSFILLVSGAEKTIAFGADAVHREQEVLVKSLGKQCVRVKNIMAATVMGRGNVIPILNPVDLIRSSIKGGVNRSEKLEKKEGTIQREILLVEDSITTRMLLKNILESAGYGVKTAVDGVEALEILKNQRVDLMLTDIEMPRMDGFTLLEKVKKIPTLQSLPVIICTSRGSQEDREKGIELGANAYIDKSSFTHQGLLDLLKKLL